MRRKNHPAQETALLAMWSAQEALDNWLYAHEDDCLCDQCEDVRGLLYMSRQICVILESLACGVGELRERLEASKARQSSPGSLPFNRQPPSSN